MVKPECDRRWPAVLHCHHHCIRVPLFSAKEGCAPDFCVSGQDYCNYHMCHWNPAAQPEWSTKLIFNLLKFFYSTPLLSGTCLRCYEWLRPILHPVLHDASYFWVVSSWLYALTASKFRKTHQLEECNVMLDVTLWFQLCHFSDVKLCFLGIL